MQIRKRTLRQICQFYFFESGKNTAQSVTFKDNFQDNTLPKVPVLLFSKEEKPELLLVMGIKRKV